MNNEKFQEGDVVNLSPEYLEWYQQRAGSKGMIEENELSGWTVRKLHSEFPERVHVQGYGVGAYVPHRFVSKK